VRVAKIIGSLTVRSSRVDFIGGGSEARMTSPCPGWWDDRCLVEAGIGARRDRPAKEMEFFLRRLKGRLKTQIN
jgi:hypothetical protein